jgi:aryl-alcohol dehydrogenase-like predicted oxidoreductase
MVQTIPQRTLGRTGLRITELALGGGGIGGLRTTDSDNVGAATVKRGIELGITHIDTAPAYQQSERRFGMALRESGGLPPGIHISTKSNLHLSPSGEYLPAETRRSVDNSLRVLGVESVDVLFVHAPRSMEPVLAPGGMLEQLEHMREEGKFRWIGLGERDHGMHRQAIRSGRFDVILTYADYNLVRQTAAPLIEEASRAGVGVMLAQAFLFGLLAGPEPDAAEYAAHDYSHYLVADVKAAHAWWVWAQERGVSLRAVALQYALRHPLVGTLIVGADAPHHIEESVSAAYEPIAPEIWTEVEQRVMEQQVAAQAVP